MCIHNNIVNEKSISYKQTIKTKQTLLTHFLCFRVLALKPWELSPARGQHVCSVCNKPFSSRHHLVRHMRSVHERSLSHACPVCGKMFCRKDVLNKHLKSHYRWQSGSSWQQQKAEPVTESETEQAVKDASISHGSTENIWLPI